MRRAQWEVAPERPAATQPEYMAAGGERPARAAKTPAFHVILPEIIGAALLNPLHVAGEERSGRKPTVPSRKIKQEI